MCPVQNYSFVIAVNVNIFMYSVTMYYVTFLRDDFPLIVVILSDKILEKIMIYTLNVMLNISQ